MPTNGSVQIRTQNKSNVLNVIKQHDRSTRAEIAELTHMTKATISEIVSQLIHEGLVIEHDKNKSDSKAGRKGIAISFNKNADYAISIDLGGTKIAISLFNIGLELITHKTIPTFKVSLRAQFIEKLNTAIAIFIQEAGIPTNSISVIGIATAGIVENTTGFVLEGSPNLPQWEGFSLAGEIQDQLNIPVVVENDVRAALVGEIFKGKCKDTQSAMLIGIGTGLGSALVIDGKLIRGTNNAAGEIGYMVLSREQLNQNWHNKGALETHCSGSGIEQRYYQLTNNQLSSKAIFILAEHGDFLAKSLVEELSDSLALGIINAIAIANPEKVVLYGGVCLAATQFLERTQSIIDRHTLANTRITLELSSLGNHAPVYGMAVMAMASAHPDIQFLPNIQLK
ncbi:ROK family protein [Photobacterium nomapromontoriensis]|uniref:ROK family protein n=1 Tax=Photobacterium nomapromontoriensis TaxID=2910237 RepID=UPI003D118396